MGRTNRGDGRQQEHRRDSAPEGESDEQHKSPLPAGPLDRRHACADAGHVHGYPARDHCEPPLAGCGIVQHPGPARFFPPHRTNDGTIYWIICVQSTQSDKFGEVNVRSAMEHAVSGNNDEANGSDIPSPVSQPLQFRCADGVLLAGHLWQGGGRGLVIINAATGVLARYYHRYAAFLAGRSEEHTSELKSLMRISYAVFCLKKKTTII